MGDAPVLERRNHPSHGHDGDIRRITLIQRRSVEKFYGARAVLRGVAMKVAPGARIGLVGGNGAEKSTLLRVVGDLEEVDGGEVIQRRVSRVAYLPQHVGGDGRIPLEVLRAATRAATAPGGKLGSA